MSCHLKGQPCQPQGQGVALDVLANRQHEQGSLMACPFPKQGAAAVSCVGNVYVALVFVISCSVCWNACHSRVCTLLPSLLSCAKHWGGWEKVGAPPEGWRERAEHMQVNCAYAGSACASHRRTCVAQLFQRSSPISTGAEGQALTGQRWPAPLGSGSLVNQWG